MRKRDLRTSLWWPITSPPNLHYSSCWNVRIVLLAQTSHFFVGYFSCACYLSRTLSQNSCSPRDLWIWLWVNILIQWPTWVYCYIYLCLSMGISGMDYIYLLPYFPAFCNLMYICPDVMVEFLKGGQNPLPPWWTPQNEWCWPWRWCSSGSLLFWVVGYQYLPF